MKNLDKAVKTVDKSLSQMEKEDHDQAIKLAEAIIANVKGKNYKGAKSKMVSLSQQIDHLVKAYEENDFRG